MFIFDFACAEVRLEHTQIGTFTTSGFFTMRVRLYFLFYPRIPLLSAFSCYGNLLSSASVKEVFLDAEKWYSTDNYLLLN